MFKIIALFVVVACVASVSAKADPKPQGVFTYSAPVVATTGYVAAPATATVFEQSFHGNFAPAVYADGTYLAPPLAYSYSAYDPFVAAAAPVTVLLK
ncbi:uncharacterized protein LOC135708559 [Ochlerotatus camptorhynchus]|uniref:uncharacterized protein LOC135708559 n=1 Tax=Ochlerotatus camptorhynchus TaxID=644619 RepID=UPI0031CFCF9D